MLKILLGAVIGCLIGSAIIIAHELLSHGVNGLKVRRKK